MEDVGIFYWPFVYFLNIWYILWPYFVAMCMAYLMVNWFISPHFGMLYREKSGSPD
jgi:hypothetical protein